MKIKKGHVRIGILMISVILLVNFVSAFGVGSVYHSEHPLELPRGGTADVKFNLQNMAGGKNITARPNLLSGSEVMVLESSEDVSLPLGASVDVIGRVTIPVDAEVGDIYPIQVTFTTVTESDSGEFGFGSSVGRGFDVIVVYSAEELAMMEEKSTNYGLYLTIGLIILIVVVGWFLLRRRK